MPFSTTGNNLGPPDAFIGAPRQNFPFFHTNWLLETPNLATARLAFGGVVHIDQVTRFEIFLNSASGMVPDGWVGLKSFGYICYFRAFQLKLDNLDTQNIGNGSVVAKLQPRGVGKISEISGKSELISASTRTRRDYWWSVFIHFWDPQKVFSYFL